MTKINTADHLPVPAWIDREVWDAFVEMRAAKGRRAPFTATAKKMILNKLARIRAEGHDANECLRESVMQGWSGVFAPKGQAHKPEPERPWHATRSGIEAVGVQLGLGRWDQEAFEHGRGPTFAAYTARVMRRAGAS